LKIMHVILSRGFAGSERSTVESCNSHAQLGHEVLLVVKRSHRHHGHSIRDHVVPAVQVREVNNRLFTRRQIGRVIAEFQPDVIHTHLRRSTRLVAQLDPPAATIATLHLSLSGRHYLLLDGLICNANWQKRDIPASYKGLVFKANNSLVPHPRLSPEAVAALRAELGAGPNDFLIGGVGRLVYSKGWDVLIRAFQQANLPNARCVVLGEGRERRRLEKLAAGAVALPGFRKNVKDYYQAFDLFVCPSRREPLPRVILEALDAGTPVVASMADGCRELLEVYPGDLFPIEDADSLAKLLQQHHAARTPRREVDLSPHHLDHAALALLERYEAVIAHRQQRLAQR
jgi:glycosyltransferase involved in cell wall biosynthesis